MVMVWPTPRKSKLLSAALNVRTIEPEPVSAPYIVVESAPASTAASPLGGAPSPVQVTEDTLALTSLTLKLVKVSAPEVAVSRSALPVVLAISLIACGPEASAVSTGLTTGGSTGGGLNTG